MGNRKAARPTPRKTAGKTTAGTFQSRVDYVAKALCRGSWGLRFDECFEQHDGNHVIGAVMLRARRNGQLKDAIVRAFDAPDWDQVPWHDQASAFAGMSARDIGRAAETARAQAQENFRALYDSPEQMLATAI